MQFPFLNEGFNFVDPQIGNILDFVIASLQSGYFIIGFFVSCHFLGSSISSCENFEVIKTSLVKSIDFIKKSKGFIKIGWLAESFSRCIFSLCEPGIKLLDACSVFCPVLDILGECITFLSCFFLKIKNVSSNSIELIFEELGIFGYFCSLRKEFGLFSNHLLNNNNLCSNFFLEIHC